MNTKDFLTELANLILKSDEGTKDWIKEPILLRFWYILCGLLLFLIITSFISSLFISNLVSSTSLSLAYRLTMLLILSSINICIIFLATHYYRFALKNKGKIKINNIAKFYILYTLVFSQMYFFLYTIDPDQFKYIEPATTFSETVKPISNIFDVLKVKGDFLLFSAVQSMNGSFYKISGHSAMVSLFGYIQGLSTLLLIGLFVASYVNQRTNN